MRTGSSGERVGAPTPFEPLAVEVDNPSRGFILGRPRREERSDLSGTWRPGEGTDLSEADCEEMPDLPSGSTCPTPVSSGAEQRGPTRADGGSGSRRPPGQTGVGEPFLGRDQGGGLFWKFPPHNTISECNTSGQRNGLRRKKSLKCLSTGKKNAQIFSGTSLDFDPRLFVAWEMRIAGGCAVPRGHQKVAGIRGIGGQRLGGAGERGDGGPRDTHGIGVGVGREVVVAVARTAGTVRRGDARWAWKAWWEVGRRHTHRVHEAEQNKATQAPCTGMRLPGAPYIFDDMGSTTLRALCGIGAQHNPTGHLDR